MVDMATDRCTISRPVECVPGRRVPEMEHCLLRIIQLGLCKPLYTLCYIATGGSSVSYKEMGEARAWAMRLYYSNTRWVGLQESDGSS